jgi:MFS transporter, FHS family, glucose/mannose:H+ symporter
MNNLRVKLSLFLNYFVFAILLNSVGTVILLVQTYFQVTAKSASYLDPFKDLSIAFASFIVGAIVTKVGYRKSMIIALLSVTIACFIIPSLKYFLAVKLLYAVFGFSFGLTKVSVFGAIGLVTNSQKEHLSFMNFIESFFMVGVLCGYYLFAAFSKNAEAGNWFTTFYIVGGLSLAALILLLSTKLDESAIKKTESSSFQQDVAAMFKLAALPFVLSFVVCAFFYVLIEQSSMNWFPTFNKDVLKMSETLAITLGSILSASIALGRFMAGVVLRKINWFTVLVICVIGAAIVMFISLNLIGDTQKQVESFADVPLVAFIMPLIGLFLAPIYPAINSVILASLPKEKHGAMSGLIVIFSAIGGTLGSVITGYLFDEVGGVNAFYYSFIPMAILLLFLFLFYKQQSRSKSDISFNSSASH